MTYADYVIKAHFYHTLKNDEIKLSWEQARYIAFCTVATQTDKIKTPQQLIAFPWEEVKKVTQRTVNKVIRDARKNYAGHLRFLKTQEKEK